jgi:serine protease Do
VVIAVTQDILPAVVSLRVYSNEKSPKIPKDHPALPEDVPAYGTGSGVIIRTDGLLITNYHVVEDAINIEVYLYTGDMFTAKVLGHDAIGDLALLQIETDQSLPVAPLGSSSALKVGEFVVAIGSPFGFEHTITFGIVSGKKRHLLHCTVRLSA